MKKLLILALFLMAILLVSCNTETPSESLPSESISNESLPNESVMNESTDNTSTHVHNFSGKAEFDKKGHFVTCECGEVSRSEHIMDDVKEIKETTCIEEGLKETKCKDCEYSSEVAIPKISHNYKDEFCTMCGSHEPSDEIAFEYRDEYGWIALLRSVRPENSQITELYIPTYTDEGEKVVAVDQFWNLPKLKNVIIPDGIECILEHAFDGCKNLEEVTFLCDDPSSDIIIDEGAFTGCIRLKKVAFPNSKVTVGRFVFKNCYSLKEVDLGNGITKLSYEMFRGCSALETIVIPDSVTEIDGNVFYGCEKLKTIVLPKNLKRMQGYVFAACTSLESITIPKSIEYLGGGGVFDNCKALKEVNYEGTIEDWNNIPIYDSKAFSGSSVKRIICSDGVIEV